MLLENLVIGKTIEINVYREEYHYHMKSKVEVTSPSRVCVTLIASNNKVFKFKPDDRVKLVYRDSDKIWEWDNVKASIVKKGDILLHCFDIADGGKSVNRRNAYRITVNEELMVGYYDQYDTTAKSADMQKFDPEEEMNVPRNLTVPQFVHGFVRDISETGVGVYSNYEFNIGDGMFFSITSHYGKLPVKAKVVRKVERDIKTHKYARYYGCILLQTDSRLSKHIFDIQRMAIRSQKQREDEEEMRISLMKLERGILDNRNKLSTGDRNMQVKGIKTVADMKDKNSTEPRQKVEGIVTADEVQEREVKIRQRQKVEGIVTADEVQEREVKIRQRQKVEGIVTAEEAREREIKAQQQQKNREPSPEIEGIKTAGLK